jgi:UDP-N-acetylmuramoyl-L-alanyl-D-glutamate--2,6-diaminopimelate ligase
LRLDELIESDALGGPVASIQIAGLAYDSRRVADGTLFFCVPGFDKDGHDFAQQAVQNGASALLVQRPLGLGVPEVLVESVRAAMGPISARFYGDPTDRLKVLGVTGTNGKTTTAFLLRALLQATGQQCALLGTVKSVVGGIERPVTRTTPEAIDLQADFRAMLDQGDSSCAMEVSSHALKLGRTDGVHFAAAIFTNLTQDHLDFHQTMEDYFQAKRRLFIAPTAALQVLNVDDPYGRRLKAELPDAVTFGIEHDADYRAKNVEVGFSGCRLQLQTPDGSRAMTLALPGVFNVSNALGALATVHSMGADLDLLVATLERGVHIPGRFEPVDEGQQFAVLVDYAHTPDSLENVLQAAREVAAGRVLCVFGAGGDRDRGKRPLMGEIAARMADIVVVTSDNPRSEDPDQIIREIMAGIAQAGTADVLKASCVVSSEVDRQTAILQAISMAQPQDVVVIAGKGHEQGQEFGQGKKVPFDDVTVARQALRARQMPTDEVLA